MPLFQFPTILIILTYHSTNAYKILFLTPLGTRSETHLFQPYAKALLTRGHQITYISSQPSGVKNNPNFEEIIPTKPFTMIDFTGNISMSPVEIRAVTKDKLSSILSWNFTFIFDRCHQVFQNEQFNNLVRRETTYDLIITNAFFNNCFHGLIHKFGAPFIAVHTMPVDAVVGRMTGLRMPTSFVPVSFLDFSDRMSFYHRFVNTICTWAFSYLLDNAKQEYTRIYRHYMGEEYPWSEDIESNVSVLMSNSHVSIYFPRPLLPNIVEIAGIHCRPAKPLENIVSFFTHILYVQKMDIISMQIYCTGIEKIFGSSGRAWIHFVQFGIGCTNEFFVS